MTIDMMIKAYSINLKKIYIHIIFIVFIYSILMCFYLKNTIQKKNNLEENVESKQPDRYNKLSFYEQFINTSGEDFNFDQDVLVLLHIQKTSGTLWEMHLLKHLYIKRNQASSFESVSIYNNKAKRYVPVTNKLRKPIFWDRYMMRYCDIHADYSELNNCLMQEYKNRIIALPPNYPGIFHFMTFLRDPIHRYASEYEYVKTGMISFIYLVLSFKRLV